MTAAAEQRTFTRPSHFLNATEPMREARQQEELPPPTVVVKLHRFLPDGHGFKLGPPVPHACPQSVPNRRPNKLAPQNNTRLNADSLRLAFEGDEDILGTFSDEQLWACGLAYCNTHPVGREDRRYLSLAIARLCAIRAGALTNIGRHEFDRTLVV
jgi:hypothetical protein